MSAVLHPPLPTRPISNRFGLVFVAPLSILILARLLLQAYLYRSGFLALTADDFGRVLQAANWAVQPHLVWSGVWLPFHMYLHGLALKLYPDMLIVPRILTIALGVVSLLLMARLGSRLFADVNVGLISAFLLAANPAHIWLSSTPLTELPYFTLLLGCLAALAEYFHGGRRRWAWVSAACLALANGFRFEGWMFSLPFSVLLAGRAAALVRRQPGSQAGRREAGALLLAAGLPWVFPLLWMSGSYLQSGSAFEFLEAIRQYKATRFLIEPAFRPYLATLARIDLVSLILAVPGLALILAPGRRSASWYALFVILPLGIFLALHAGQYDPPGNLIRYLAPFSFLFLPLAAGALLVGIRRLPIQGLSQALVLVLFLSGVALLQGRAAFRLQNDPAALGIRVGERLKALRQEDPLLARLPVLVEIYDWEFLAIQVGANETGTVLYDRQPDPLQPSPSLLSASPASIRACLDQYGIGMLLLRSPELKAAVEDRLGLEAQEELNGYSFYPVPDSLQVEEGACALTSGGDW
jgi:hypothetical protein